MELTSEQNDIIHSTGNIKIYDTVHLVNDFITEEKIIELNINPNDEAGIAKINEEINLLYVAVTRAKNHLYIPQSLMPENFQASGNIHIIKGEQAKQSALSKANERTSISFKNGGDSRSKDLPNKSIGRNTAKHKDAYKPWTDELDEELTIMYCNGADIKEMADHFNRTKGAIWARVRKLELEELYG